MGNIGYIKWTQRPNFLLILPREIQGGLCQETLRVMDSVQSWVWLWHRAVKEGEGGLSLAMGGSKAKLYLTANSLELQLTYL